MKTFKKFLSNIYISKPKTKFINTKAFTLVELIIVITILAILGTVAFVSYKGYTKSARNSARVSTIGEIEKGLEIYKIKTGTYPEPGDDITLINASSTTISKQGYFGSEQASIPTI